MLRLINQSLIRCALHFYHDQLAKVQPGSGDEYVNARLDIHHVQRQLDDLSAPVNSTELLQKTGGQWLGVVREWIKCKCRNGEYVTWGSDDTLQMPRVSVQDLEYLAAKIAAAAINEACALHSLEKLVAEDRVKTIQPPQSTQSN